MKRTHPTPEALIAPCGMNCAICSRYLSYVNGLKRSQCGGCRSQDQVCEYLLQKCAGASHGTTANAAFCFECSHYPCQQINRMDSRYRANYGMSVKDNLEAIKSEGLSCFVDSQYEEHSCSKCGGLVSIHNGKCFRCDRVTRLVEKRDRRS
jgi:hypothetical protein